MLEVNYEGNDIVLPGIRRDAEPTRFPKEFIAAIAKSGSLYDIERAVAFYRMVGENEYRWAKASELVGVDTSDNRLFFYDANYEDSAWESIHFAKTFAFDENNEGYVHAISLIDEENEEGYYRSHWTGDSILVVTKSPEQIEADKADLIKQQEFYSEQKIQDAAEEAKRAAEGKPVENSELAEWERELLRLGEENENV